jgi:hypothetical protein
MNRTDRAAPAITINTADRVSRSMTEAECMCLLASKTVGRIIFVEDGFPMAYPVNFRLRKASIIFATADTSALLSAISKTPAAFQVDSIDECARIGWSILARGWCQPMPVDVARDARLHSWMSGRRLQVVRLSIDFVQGRRLEPVEGSAGLVLAEPHVVRPRIPHQPRHHG